jgi:hypothetical protein
MQMTATVRTTLEETRILVSDETGDRLIARLPPLRSSHHWALRALLESLALWSDRRLHVVLYVSESCYWQHHGWSAAFELAADSLHLEVDIAPHEALQGRARRLTGLGRFDRERRLHRRQGA